jgi:hypothetical protein
MQRTLVGALMLAQFVEEWAKIPRAVKDAFDTYATAVVQGVENYIGAQNYRIGYPIVTRDGAHPDAASPPTWSNVP